MAIKTELEILGDLYEEGKDRLHQLSILEDEKASYWRLFEIIKEMRDLTAPHLPKTKPSLMLQYKAYIWEYGNGWGHTTVEENTANEEEAIKRMKFLKEIEKHHPTHTYSNFLLCKGEVVIKVL